jgi:hypothetical protein
VRDRPVARDDHCGMPASGKRGVVDVPAVHSGSASFSSAATSSANAASPTSPGHSS